MPPSPAYRPRPLFEKLGGDFAAIVQPAGFPALKLRHRNQRSAESVGLGSLSAAEWEDAFARFHPLPDNMAAPLAMAYHGHQFRVYNPDIGDGRGFLFAQLEDVRGRVLDLATKGSGRTPWSRTGDGRLTLKGGVREILAAEMLEARGVNTSKAFSLFETGEALQRQDEPSPTRACVLTRLSHSHIRFGAFQRLAYLERADLIRMLIDHAIEAYYPELSGIDGEDRAAALYAAIVAACARLIAHWMAAGFVHGVLNTDNMTITGESFDYGPWRFLPHGDPNFTAAYFDQNGLYAYGRQPEAGAWNLAQLGGCFAQVCPRARIEAQLAGFADLYRDALVSATFNRLGLGRGERAADLRFLQALFTWMNESGAGHAQFFHDWFCGEASAARAREGPQAALYVQEAFAPIKSELMGRAPVHPERLANAYFNRAAPCDMLIEEVEAIWAAIAAHDDWRAFEAKIADIRLMGAAHAGVD